MRRTRLLTRPRTVPGFPMNLPADPPESYRTTGWRDESPDGPEDPGPLPPEPEGLPRPPRGWWPREEEAIRGWWR
jgi:hypothetical protein